MNPPDPDYLRRHLIYEDRYVLAFNKPPGLASQGGSGVARSLEDELAHWPRINGKRPHLAHRLDLDTSGVIVAGRTPAALAHLNAQFAGRESEKVYHAIVCGAPPAEGEIDAPLLKVRQGKIDLVRIDPTSPHAQMAVTRFRTVKATHGAALVELTPLTGRMHQLRAHMAHLGAPIAGDRKYGGLMSLLGFPVEGLMLHAARLTLAHPKGERLVLEAPPPERFSALARALELA
jgi:tRNA pseudouridine32 synthase/23S rRNA pseudouridine746 synthase